MVGADGPLSPCDIVLVSQQNRKFGHGMEMHLAWTDGVGAVKGIQDHGFDTHLSAFVRTNLYVLRIKKKCSA